MSGERLLVEVPAGLAHRVRTPTPADLVAHVAALPAEEARVLLVALLRARPDEAVVAVDTCKVARAWFLWGGCELERAPLGSVDGMVAVAKTAPGERAAADAALLADGWVLAAGVTP
jgi:hypothetical protein